MRILLGGISLQDTEIVGALPSDVMVASAATADELIENSYACSPDILIVSAELPEIGTALQQISTLLPVPVVMIASGGDANAELHLTAIDLYAYLVRPVTPVNVRQAITIACTQFQRLHGIRAEANQLREAFASRKVIDRAKGIMMQRRQISEAEAYTLLREESRRQRVPIVEIARAVLGESGEAAPPGASPQNATTIATRRSITSPVNLRFSRG